MDSQPTNIQDIPYDDEIIDDETETVINSLFSQINTDGLTPFKITLYSTILFSVLSTPFIDRLLQLVIPTTEIGWVILLTAKTVIFFVLMYLITKFAK
jgi:hypothetical protein